MAQAKRLAGSQGKWCGGPELDRWQWLTRVALFTGLIVAAYGLAAYLSGASGMADALQRIGSGAIVTGLCATAASLAVRAARWQLIFLHLRHRLPAVLQLRIYLSGLALTSTPGKAGETLRSLLLRPYGIPYTHSLAAFVCDRLADVVGIAALGAAVAALLGTRQPILEAIAFSTLLLSVLAGALLRSGFGSRYLCVRPRWFAIVLAPGVKWAELWRGSALIVYIGAAMLSYGIQGLVFAAFVGQLHSGLDWAACLVIFVNATLIGAASLVPGGLGTMDAAMVIQLQAAGVPAGEALAAAMTVRLCTLGLASVLGAGALLTFRRSVTQS